MSDPQTAIEPKACIDERKRALADANVKLSHERPWGLALSGGGIRSATFCFGLLKALAANKLFREFDLMSTVSGGGYIGSTVGRLLTEQQKIAQTDATPPDPIKVEEAIGQADTRLFAAWLRANGRYLIPGGSKDLLFAAASYGRNLFAVHFELALLSLLLGGVLIGADLFAWQWGDGVFRSAAAMRSLGYQLLGAIDWLPAVCLFIPFFIWLGVVLASAFWAVPTAKSKPFGWPRPIITCIFIAVIVVLVSRNLPFFLHGELGYAHEAAMKWPMLILIVGMLSAMVIGHGLAIALAMNPKRDLDWARNRLTAWLSWCLTVGLGLSALGIIDYLAWMLATIDAAKQSILGLLAIAVTAALRGSLPKIADLPRGLTPMVRGGLLGIVNFVGLCLIGFVLVFWISIEHRAVAGVMFVPGATSLEFDLAWRWLFWMVLPPAVLVGLSWRNREFLNRSSLHTFYRARLVRGYLGAGNPHRFSKPGGEVKDTLANLREAQPVFRVGEVNAADDVPMRQYAPHLAGGPVHLMNVCVNQTVDPRGGLFNQDRKGVLMTVGPRAAVCVGSGEWTSTEEASALTLGSWVAISGAAVAPGLGASTRPGVSALMMLAGLRLGYWWDSSGFGNAAAKRISKYGEFMNEIRGRFAGTERREWFLSDGGHFENTAAYALLREECEVIVVADCGADPRYAFGDLENLVRKARIDLQAEITFLRPKEADDARKAFGSLNEIASAESEACIALARIDYRHSGKTGWMFIVKPNMCQGLPVDLVNFKADSPMFPQEPTTDQFFSEAQWESYFQLGNILGGKLAIAHLQDAKAFATTYFVDDDGVVVTHDEDGKAVLQAPRMRLSSRIASTGAVSATIGLGGVLSVCFAAWQAVDAEFHNRSLASRIEPSSYRELTDIFGKLPTSPGTADAAETIPAERLGQMATTLLRVGDAVCTTANTPAFRESSLMSLMVARTKEACRTSSPRHPSCDELLRDDKIPACLQEQPRIVCEPMYWGRDYGSSTQQGANCWLAPGTPAPTAYDEPPAKPTVTASASRPASAPVAAASRPLLKGGVRVPASAASSPLPAVTPPVVAASAPMLPKTCEGQTIYIQIYGPELRDKVREILRPRFQALGASVPPIEDVWDSARRAGRRLAMPYASPTVLYRNEASLACAKALMPPDAPAEWVVRPLRANLDGASQAVEVWIPPTWRQPPK